MVLESWDLGTLKRQVRDEFGLDDEANVNRKITDKINQAVQWIIARKQNWPWMRMEYFFDVPVATSGTGTFTKGSRSVIISTGATPSVRDILVPSISTASGTNGYLVSAVNSGVITLQTQYRGESAVAKTYQIQKGFFKLPDDFMRMETSADLNTLVGVEIKYVPPTQFDRVKRDGDIISSFNKLYTVKSDPLGTDRSYYYAIFPFMEALTTVQGEYYRLAPKLVDNGDIPIIPRQESPTLLYFAFWFFALSENEDKADTYLQQASTLLEAMAKEYQLSEDRNISTTAYEPDWIQATANFPVFDDE